MCDQAVKAGFPTLISRFNPWTFRPSACDFCLTQKKRCSITSVTLSSSSPEDVWNASEIKYLRENWNLYTKIGNVRITGPPAEPRLSVSAASLTTDAAPPDTIGDVPSLTPAHQASSAKAVSTAPPPLPSMPSSNPKAGRVLRRSASSVSDPRDPKRLRQASPSLSSSEDGLDDLSPGELEEFFADIADNSTAQTESPPSAAELMAVLDASHDLATKTLTDFNGVMSAFSTQALAHATAMSNSLKSLTEEQLRVRQTALAALRSTSAKEDEITRLKSRISELERRVRDLSENLAANERELRETVLSLTRVQQEKEDAVAAHQRDKDMFHKQRSQYVEINTRNQDLTDQVASLNDEVARYKAKIDKWRVRLRPRPSAVKSSPGPSQPPVVAASPSMVQTASAQPAAPDTCSAPAAAPLEIADAVVGAPTHLLQSADITNLLSEAAEETVRMAESSSTSIAAPLTVPNAVDRAPTQSSQPTGLAEVMPEVSEELTLELVQALGSSREDNDSVTPVSESLAPTPRPVLRRFRSASTKGLRDPSSYHSQQRNDSADKLGVAFDRCDTAPPAQSSPTVGVMQSASNDRAAVAPNVQQSRVGAEAKQVTRQGQPNAVTSLAVLTAGQPAEEMCQPPTEAAMSVVEEARTPPAVALQDNQPAPPAGNGAPVANAHNSLMASSAEAFANNNVAAAAATASSEIAQADKEPSTQGPTAPGHHTTPAASAKAADGAEANTQVSDEGSGATPRLAGQGGPPFTTSAHSSRAGEADDAATEQAFNASADRSAHPTSGSPSRDSTTRGDLFASNDPPVPLDFNFGAVHDDEKRDTGTQSTNSSGSASDARTDADSASHQDLSSSPPSDSSSPVDNQSPVSTPLDQTDDKLDQSDEELETGEGSSSDHS